ncbi:MAG TPA: hypothetical protein VGF67_11080 [Ktedonobacteraceae bacterium]|jgi:hypothetical protein
MRDNRLSVHYRGQRGKLRGSGPPTHDGDIPLFLQSLDENSSEKVRVLAGIQEQ